jgi:hypothetical protein
MSRQNWSVGFISTALVLLLTACGAVKVEEWKTEPSAQRMLAGESNIEGFRYRPPNQFSLVPKKEKNPVMTQWIGGDPPVWYVKDGEQATADHWEDPNQVRVIQGMCPRYMGSTDMVRCETEAVPRQFHISVRPTKFPDTDDNLATLATHEVDSMRQSVVTEDYERSPIEYGTINGVKFARTTWTAKVPVIKRMPSVQENVASPAQGYSYATILDGKVIQITGQTPKGDGWYKAIEQAALSFSPGTHTKH